MSTNHRNELFRSEGAHVSYVERNLESLLDRAAEARKTGEPGPKEVPINTAENWRNKALYIHDDQVYYTTMLSGGMGGGDVYILSPSNNEGPEPGVTNLVEGQLDNDRVFMPAWASILYKRVKFQNQSEKEKAKVTDFNLTPFRYELDALENKTEGGNPVIPQPQRNVPEVLENADFQVWQGSTRKYREEFESFFTTVDGPVGKRIEKGDLAVPMLEPVVFQPNIGLSWLIRFNTRQQLPGDSLTGHIFQVIFGGLTTRLK